MKLEGYAAVKVGVVAELSAQGAEAEVPANSKLEEVKELEGVYVCVARTAAGDTKSVSITIRMPQKERQTGQTETGQTEQAQGEARVVHGKYILVYLLLTLAEAIMTFGRDVALTVGRSCHPQA